MTSRRCSRSLAVRTYALPDEKRNATSIGDFQGYMVEAFKLRSLATKFGYTRGQAQDGGWFYDYAKTFSGLGLKVELSFSGNGLPEENRSVALTDLSFQRGTRGGRVHANVRRRAPG